MNEVDTNHRDIINHYASKIAETYTESELRNIATTLLAHMSYLLGRESAKEGNRNEQTDRR